MYVDPAFSMSCYVCYLYKSIMSLRQNVKYILQNVVCEKRGLVFLRDSVHNKKSALQTIDAAQRNAEKM